METTKINASTHLRGEEDASTLDIDAASAAAASLMELLFNICSGRVSTKTLRSRSSQMTCRSGFLINAHLHWKRYLLLIVQA